MKDKDKDVEIARLRAKVAADQREIARLNLQSAKARAELDEKLRQVRAWLSSNDDRDDLEALAEIVK